jgi:hypothetical protein
MTLEERLVAQTLNIDEKQRALRTKYGETGATQELVEVSYCAGWVRGLQQALQWLRDEERS